VFVAQVKGLDVDTKGMRLYTFTYSDGDSKDFEWNKFVAVAAYNLWLGLEDEDEGGGGSQ
jgi:hypothetical protein